MKSIQTSPGTLHGELATDHRPILGEDQLGLRCLGCCWGAPEPDWSVTENWRKDPYHCWNSGCPQGEDQALQVEGGWTSVLLFLPSRARPPESWASCAEDWHQALTGGASACKPESCEGLTAGWGYEMGD